MLSTNLRQLACKRNALITPPKSLLTTTSYRQFAKRYFIVNYKYEEDAYYKRSKF